MIGARRVLVGCALFAASLGFALPAGASTHPPDITAEGDCDAWVGSVNGNDPDMRVSARICPAGGDAVKGRFQTSSLKSGYSVRDFEGRWIAGRTKLEAHDVRMVEDHPNPGWMFCMVDDYALELRAPDELAGTLLSKPCRDHARVVLTRVPKPPAPPASGSGPPSPTPPGPPPASSASSSGASANTTPAPSSDPTGAAPAPLPEEPNPAPRPRRSSCACALVAALPAPDEHAVGLVLLAGFAVAWGRTSRRTRV